MHWIHSPCRHERHRIRVSTAQLLHGVGCLAPLIAALPLQLPVMSPCTVQLGAVAPLSPRLDARGLGEAARGSVEDEPQGCCPTESGRHAGETDTGAAGGILSSLK
jgi:hypothetical protein